MNGKTMLNGVPYFSDTQVIELTRAEYDALPNSKYTDGVLYCIKDEGVMKGDTFSPIIYSLAEREVGVWVDGKPLYQKTVVGNVLGNSQSQTTLYTCTNEELHMYSLKLKNPDTGGVLNANCIFSSTTYNYRCVLDTSNLLLIRSDVYAWAAWFPTTTIWYTKTTDNPGTGKWTTSGVPAHHYSTDEQVIGTWIDGKPIYEKTYEFSTPLLINHSNWVATAFPSPSIKKVLRADGIQEGNANAPILVANINGYINILFNRYNAYETELIAFTIQYTKTTD